MARLYTARKLLLHELFVIELLIREAQARFRGLFAPAGLVVGAAFRTGERTRRNVLTADGADLGRGGTAVLARHGSGDDAQLHGVETVLAREHVGDNHEMITGIRQLVFDQV